MLNSFVFVDCDCCCFLFQFCSIRILRTDAVTIRSTWESDFVWPTLRTSTILITKTKTKLYCIAWVLRVQFYGVLYTTYDRYRAKYFDRNSFNISLFTDCQPMLTGEFRFLISSLWMYAFLSKFMHFQKRKLYFVCKISIDLLKKYLPVEYIALLLRLVLWPNTLDLFSIFLFRFLNHLILSRLHLASIADVSVDQHNKLFAIMRWKKQKKNE